MLHKTELEGNNDFRAEGLVEFELLEKFFIFLRIWHLESGP